MSAEQLAAAVAKLDLRQHSPREAHAFRGGLLAHAVVFPRLSKSPRKSLAINCHQSRLST